MFHRYRRFYLNADKQRIGGLANSFEAGVLEGAVAAARQHYGRRVAVVLSVNGAAVEGDAVAVAHRHMAIIVSFYTF
jgi:hypothetical protein